MSYANAPEPTTITQQLSGLSVTVAGAGVGGLATAVALRRLGASVTVFERADRLEPVGAGLSLFPNAVRALRELGVAEALEAPSIPRGDGGLWRADGASLVKQDVSEYEERYGAPLLLVHRAELQDALLGALGDVEVVLGESLSGVEHDASGASATFESGRVVESDLIVGADGLRSVVRATLIGDGEPRESGLIAYRGVATHEIGERVGEFWGEGGVVGLAPLSDGRVYWYATARDDSPANGPVTLDEQAALVARLSTWTSPIAAIVGATAAGAILRHPLLDRAPAGPWSADRATLVGDAAHPMLPFLGQGACQALEDAVALSAALADTSSVGDALRAYEASRGDRARLIVKRSRAAAKVTHMRGAVARRLRDAAVRRTPAGARQRQLDAVIGLPRG